MTAGVDTLPAAPALPVLPVLPVLSAPPSPAERARQLVDHPAPAGDAVPDVLALAWALKDLCYEAWSSDPPRAARAAAALRTLQGGPVPAAQQRAVAGLADWTAGIAEVTRGRMAEAVHCFDLAGAALREAGLPDPAAQSQVPKIMALSMLGQHGLAADCAEATQRELRTLGNLRAAARVSQNLGVLQLRRDLYPEAARHFREATVLFARLRDHEHSVLADIGLADTQTAMGDFDEALRIYARARMRAGNQGLTLQLALVDESVALLDLARGRYREALAGFESARRRYETLAVPQYLAIAEKQLADAYLELRLLPEALALYEAAVAKFAALALPLEQAWALAQCGRAQALLGQAAAADSLAGAARLFADQANAAGAAAVATVRSELALAGGDADAALAWATQAGQGFQEAAQADGSARAELLQAQALLQAGRVDEAGAGFDAALQRARSLQQLQLQVRCLTGQGQVALASGDPARAEAVFEAAIELFEDQRRALPGDEIRSAFLTDHLRPYQERLRLALAAGDAADVLWQLDRFRARVLDQRLSASAASGTDDAALQALRERLNWLYRRLQRLQDEAETSAALSQEMREAERALLERVRRQRLAGPAPAADGDGAAGLDADGDAGFSVAALQAALGPGDALVEYGVLDDLLFACVVTPQAVTLVRRLAPWSEVLAAERSARFQIETLRNGAAPVLQHLDRLGARAEARLQQLHRLVWAPLLPALAGAQRVLVVPLGPLGDVPFAALSDGGAPLGRRCALALAPSARVALRGLLRPPVPARRLLALAESSSLPHTAREVQTLAALFADGQAWVGDQATLARLQQQAPRADVLHLACHAQFRSDNPRFSALHLHDGALTVDLAEALDLRAGTVVLSACETGLAEAGGGDERVGLVRAFLVGGAARVLASQWPVDDAVTVGFMADFYRALLAGLAPSAALQQAQAATRQRHPHPYFWAAFTLYGGW